jgi:hypothetical protein
MLFKLIKSVWMVATVVMSGSEAIKTESPLEISGQDSFLFCLLYPTFNPQEYKLNAFRAINGDILKEDPLRIINKENDCQLKYFDDDLNLNSRAKLTSCFFNAHKNTHSKVKVEVNLSEDRTHCINSIKCSESGMLETLIVIPRR